MYQNDSLKYLGTAEGRTDMSKTTPQEQFYVKDHLGNVRSIVASTQTSGGTQQQMAMAAPQTYTATYELSQAGTEEQLFDQVSEVREDNPESTSLSNTKAAELDGSQQSKMVGSTILLKVMSGDKLHIDAQSLYNSLQQNTANPNSNIVAQIMNSVAGMSGSLPAGETGLGADMANQMFNSTEALQAYESLQQSAADPAKPQAFLNYLFFNEDMKLMPEHSQLWQAQGEDQWEAIGMDAQETVEAPMNGYVAVYLTNESQEVAYFDNMSIILDPGILIEEKHYYPYGLPMAGMGSLAANALPNRMRYQGNEYREELNLRWMDFHNRQYDPQLGRFLSIDPLADAGGQQILSPYHAMGCNPVMMIDPYGLQANLPSRPNFQVDILADMLSRFPTLASQYNMGGHMGNYTSPGMSQLIGQMREGELLAVIDSWIMNSNPAVEKSINKKGEVVYWVRFENGDKTIYDAPGANTYRLGEAVVGYARIRGATVGGSNVPQEDEEGFWEIAWNSSLARLIVPDKISLALGGDVGVLIGGGAQPINFTILTRGKDPGLYLTPTFNVNVGMLATAEGNITLTYGTFTGNPREINSSMLLGHTVGVNVSITAVAGANAGVSYSPVDINNPIRGGGFVNTSMGLNGGVGFSVSGQYQYTAGAAPLWQW